MQQVAPRHDPAPSRWAYRLERLMLTPLFRVFLRIILPFAIVFGAATLWISDEDRRDGLILALRDIRTNIESRPEFMVNVMAIDGASTGIAEDIREIVPIDFPISSFDLDLDHIQQQIAGLPAVAATSVRIRPGGIMQITVTERDPAVIWRTRDGLELVDAHGFVVSRVASRMAHPELPLIAGKGAEDHVDEALALFAAAGPLSSKLRGLVRIGERRWDVVLDRGQRLLLPETGAVQALERVIAINQAQDMLARDLVSVDMRLAARPTIRMTTRAVDELWRIRHVQVGQKEPQ